MLQILHNRRARAILHRMAWQLYEQNYEAPAIQVMGVSVRGQYLGRWLAQRLGEVSGKPVAYTDVQQADDLPADAQAAVVVVDDVLYTGGTLFQALVRLAPRPCAALQVAVLIDRGHRARPVSPDVVGLHLATTLQEYVRVTVDDATADIAAYLD